MNPKVIIINQKPVLTMDCPKYRTCQIPVTQGPAEDGMDRLWHWDGNNDTPTITPSIDCNRRCGQHRNITNGIITNSP